MQLQHLYIIQNVKRQWESIIPKSLRFGTNFLPSSVVTQQRTKITACKHPIGVCRNLVTLSGGGGKMSRCFVGQEMLMYLRKRGVFSIMQLPHLPPSPEYAHGKHEHPFV